MNAALTLENIVTTVAFGCFFVGLASALFIVIVDVLDGG